MRVVSKIVLCAALLLSSFWGEAATPFDSFRYVMRQVQQRNLKALKQFTANGGWVDVADQNGLTPLCYAMRARDYQGFELLKSQGARSEKMCAARLSSQVQEAFYADQPASHTYYTGTFAAAEKVGETALGVSALSGSTLLWTGLGVAGAAGAVALASGGGGGGSGSGGSSDSASGEPTTPDEPPLTSDAEDFNTPEYRLSGALTPIKAAEAFARGYDGKGVRVAVLDTGVYHHTDLDDNIIGGYNFDYGPCRTAGDKTNCYAYENGTLYLYKNGGKQVIGALDKESWESYFYSYANWYDWDTQKEDWTPSGNLGKDNFHGTHVAGLIAALRNNTGTEGVAPKADLIIGRVDMWDTFSESARQLFDMNPDVINVSLGLSGITASEANHTIGGMTGFEYYVGSSGVSFFKKAAETNTVLVFAAGNDGLSDASLFAAAPAANVLKGYQLDNLVISVVAVDRNLNLAAYSNRCGSTAAWCLAAPGGTSGDPIFSTTFDDGYIGLYGTSMAAPTVSGSVAVLLSAFPNLTPQNAVQILFDTATDLGAPGVDSVYGHGLVNLEAATRPQGELQLALDNSGERRTAFSGAVLNLPKALGTKALAALPKEVMVLDKYDRSFFMGTERLVRVQDTSFNHFKRSFRAFLSQPAAQKSAPSDTFSLRFSAPISDFTSGWNAGLIDMRLQATDRLEMRAFYTEDTQFFDADFDRNLLKNPFMALKDAYGIQNTYSLTPTVSVGFQTAIGRSGLVAFSEDSQLSDIDRQSYTWAFETGYMPMERLNMTATAGMTSEKGSVLGMKGEGAFETKGAETYFLGLALEWQPHPRLTLAGSWFYGETRPRRQSDVFGFHNLKSQQLALDARYHFDSNRFAGVSAVMPLLTRGTLATLLPVGRDYETDTLLMSRERLNLKPEAQEWRLNTYYTTPIGDNWLFRSEAGARLYPDGIRDNRPDWRMMLGFSYQY